MAGTCTSIACDAIGLVMTTLQLAQFIPQHIEMIIDRSVLGLSPWLLFFNSLYTYLAAMDLVILHPLSSVVVPGQSLYRGFMAAQPHVQMVGSALLSASMWVWYLWFFKADRHMEETRAQRERVAACRGGSLLSALLLPDVSPRVVFGAFLLTAAGIACAGMLLVGTLGRDAAAVIAFAQACGVAAAPLNALMWGPQIAVTAAFGHRGALSPAWVLASLLMDIAYSAYLIILGLHWSVWVNNVPDAILTASLLMIICRFDSRDRALGLDGFGRLQYHVESAPLVNSSPQRISNSVRALPL